MLSVESLPVAEEEVVESSSNKLCDIYTFVAKGCFPHTMNPLRRKNLKRYAQKFIIDGKNRPENTVCWWRKNLVFFQPQRSSAGIKKFHIQKVFSCLMCVQTSIDLK